MKKSLFVLSLVLVLMVALSPAAAKKGTWTGWVSDAKCAKNGAKAEHAACAEKCIKAGQKAVFVTGDGTVLEVANQDKVTGHAGHEVTISGSLDEATKTLTVNKVTMGGDKKKGKKAS